MKSEEPISFQNFTFCFRRPFHKNTLITLFILIQVSNNQSVENAGMAFVKGAEERKFFEKISNSNV